MPAGSDIPPLDLARLRLEYSRHSLSVSEIDPDPIRQFQRWFNECLVARAHEPNAMTLATCDASAAPSARVVLLKGVDERGFVFFTNFQSRKGRNLEENPRAALVFYWPELERQVCTEGDVTRTSDTEADAYFASRPRESQIGSAASPQSQVIASRQVLEDRASALQQQFPTGSVPRPPHWGGYRLKPRRIEFWQGRPSRLHDRIEYLLDRSGQWQIRRLAP
jgi:pyridoxamine 5'-phosphate oxidase